MTQSNIIKGTARFGKPSHWGQYIHFILEI